MSCRTEARVERNESRVGDTVDQKHDHSQPRARSLAGLGVGAHRWSRRDVLKPDPGQLLDGAVVGRSSLPEFLPGKHLRWGTHFRSIGREQSKHRDRSKARMNGALQNSAHLLWFSR